MNTKKTKTKTFEFLTLFVMVIGTVIGSGIYMKNSELLNQTNNPIIAIILWSFVGIICIMSMIVFIEISSSTKHFGNGTLGNWAKIFINRKTASFFSIMYGWVYIPSTQSVFVAGAVNYLLLAIGAPIAPYQQLIIYLLVGISIFITCTILSIYKRFINRRIQIVGILIKFLPLLIAFIAGFILIDKTGGTSSWWNGGYDKNTWGTNEWSPILFLGGFGGILFAFDGYVYIANAQKTATHKDVVPKALFAGMVFVAVFYVLMALSLFMGSPDGSIVKLFEKMLGGKESNAARIISNLILMSICLLGSNIFVDIAIVDLASDANNKTIYTKKRSMSYKEAGVIQMFIFIVAYTFLIVIGICTKREGWDGISSAVGSGGNVQNIEELLNKPADYINWFSSGTSALVFIMVLAVMVAGVINRFTKKVDVEQTKLFMVCGIISSFFMTIFIFFGIFAFIWEPKNIAKGEWGITQSGMWFLIILLVSLLINIFVFLIQEYRFKKDPYTDGWDGEINSNIKIEENLSIIADLKLIKKKILKKK
ncbi:APC family permease [Mesoplasma tabanidae]|uniref:Amino acid permease n=1 Tax=Mesoplasma tabanidae TaxID=219745 RepID=A0A2K8P387_9MOLU|nr:APC family permease [Mesoplasma tabanidae]ATZ21221.1 amino acid permease [Mesoplasma tabanidae]